MLTLVHEANMSQLLVAFMKKYNLQYTEAENGLEAVRAYQSSQAKFDVILMGKFGLFSKSDCTIDSDHLQ
jgi:CheY-like chemotaxis protein